jgi:hypothetical protein
LDESKSSSNRAFNDPLKAAMSGELPALEITNAVRLAMGDTDKSCLQGAVQIVDAVRRQEEARAFDKEISRNPMGNPEDQQIRQRIGAAILNGEPDKIAALMREYQGQGLHRLDGVMQQLEEDFRSRGISLNYCHFISMDYGKAHELIDKPIDEVVKTQLPEGSLFEISKNGHRVSIRTTPEGQVLAPCGFLAMPVQTGGAARRNFSNKETTPEEAARGMREFLNQPRRPTSDPAEVLKLITR